MGKQVKKHGYSCKLVRVVDGDTCDAMIDLGFDVWVKNRIRFYGVDTWESRTRDLEEKEKGLAAKAYVKELFGGLNPKNLPKASTFDNKYQYGEMLVEKNITVFSTCEHHLLPIYGKAHVAYFSNGNVIGLSKMNRIVDYYARRPQVQERLNIQIVRKLQEFLNTEDVACVIDAKHMCVNSRGIRHIDCSTVTGEFGGKFKDKLIKREFLDYIR